MIFLFVKAYLEVCLLKRQGTKDSSVGSNSDSKIIMISNLFPQELCKNYFIFCGTAGILHLIGISACKRNHPDCHVENIMAGCSH